MLAPREQLVAYAPPAGGPTRRAVVVEQRESGYADLLVLRTPGPSGARRMLFVPAVPPAPNRLGRLPAGTWRPL